MISLSDLCTRLAVAGHPLSIEQLLVLEGAVIRKQDYGIFPQESSVHAVHDYTAWLIQMGKGAYRIAVREHFIALPPMTAGNAFDDDTKTAFLTGLHA